MITRDQLIAPGKRPTETVTLPTRGEILMRGMSAGELWNFQKAIQSKKNGTISVDEDTFAAKLIVRCIVDKDGKRLMQDDDWKFIMDEWTAGEFQLATTTAMRLNGYGSAEGNV